MKRVSGLFPAICSLALVLACTDSPTAPAARGPSPAAPDSGAPPPGPLTNSIAMRLTPASGAVVQVFQCGTGSAYVPYCTGMDQVTAVFDVVVDRDIPDAVVSVSFMDGLRVCATASRSAVSLVAGRRSEFVMHYINLSGDPGLLCQLPVTTTAVQVAILRRNAGGAPAYLDHHTQTLPHVYTFAWPE